jgi:mono/diheme cytochrome c family protein
MTRRSWLVPVGIMAILGSVVARDASSASRQEQRSAWTAPPAADRLVNPLASRPETEAGGAKVFAQRCSQCHRDDASGTSHGPALTGRRVQSQSDGAIYWKISSGNTRTGMPSFSSLPELQRWQLVLHLRALGSSHATGSSRP